MDIGQLLTEANYDFDIDDDGDYKLLIYFGDDNDNEELDEEGRDQLVFINSKFDNLEGMEIACIWSSAFLDFEEIESRRLLRSLLEENNQLTIGAWEIWDDNSLAFVVRVPTAGLSANTLAEIIDVVSDEADDFEQEYSEEDNL